jgi:aspartate aminotransferase-like enzyme
MLRKTRLFTPGPTPLLPAAQAALAASSFHHRTADFRALYGRVLADLKTFIGTRNDVLLLASSGTGAREAAVSNLTSPGDRVLVLTAGKFGERWRELATAYGCAVEMVDAPYGETFALDAVGEKLKLGPRVVYMQATESSTGVRHDVEGVARLAAKSGALLVVDAITGLGTTDLRPDEWGLDIVIGGSQKALMIAPGLAFASVSEKAWKIIEKSKLPRYYFDYAKERKNLAKGEASYTPATTLVVTLHAALDYIRKVGRENLIANAALLAEATRAAVQALGLRLFAPCSPSNAVTAVCAPEGMDSGSIVKEMRARFGAIVANGQGSMKGKIFRLAHLGYYDAADLFAVLAALEIVLLKVGHKVELGSGVRAAQEIYLKHSA